jgi:arylsulfatase A-like enzyme
LGQRTKNKADPSPFELRTLGVLALLAGLLVNPGSVGALFAADGTIEGARFLAVILGGQIALVAIGVWLLLREPGGLGPLLFRRTATAALLLAVGGGAYGIALWVGAEPEAEPDPRPHILLVVLDTTRRDRLSLYGYERPTTPNLDRLAAESTVWDEAYATSTWTSPSHASLFTGLFPAAHGVTQSAWELRPELETLAERLRASGYRTAGVVGNPMVGRGFGFDQGFEEFRETWRERRSEEQLHPALEHLERLLASDDPRPLFAFVNIIEPHSPYTSGVEHRGEFLRHPDLELFNNQWRAYYAGEARFEPRELEHLGDVYDAGLRYVDGLVGAMVDLLRARGALDDTVLVVTSDHGENLGEHEHLDHVFSLYEPTVRIPLLARHPDSFAAGRRVDAPVQLNDVYVTLTALAGLDAGDASGLDLRRADLPRERPVLLSYDYPKQALRAMGAGTEDEDVAVYLRRLWALREGELKVIVGDDGLVEVYDLSVDPGELNDLAPEDPAHREQLRERVMSAVAEHAVERELSEPSALMDPDTEASLRELGYLGGDED